MEKTIIKPLIGAAFLIHFAAQADIATCYSVRNQQGKLLEQTTLPPVDMSRPVSETVPEKYGQGSRMTFIQMDKSACPDVTAIAESFPGRQSEKTPYFSRHIQDAAENDPQQQMLRAQKAAEQAAEIAAMRNWEPRIGMSATEVRKVSYSRNCASRKWCFPDHINTTRTANGTREQWVFRYPSAYLYFQNGILTAIQE
jgi:hypothetical protein